MLQLIDKIENNEPLITVTNLYENVSQIRCLHDDFSDCYFALKMISHTPPFHISYTLIVALTNKLLKLYVYIMLKLERVLDIYHSKHSTNGIYSF